MTQVNWRYREEGNQALVQFNLQREKPTPRLKDNRERPTETRSDARYSVTNLKVRSGQTESTCFTVAQLSLPRSKISDVSLLTQLERSSASDHSAREVCACPRDSTNTCVSREHCPAWRGVVALLDH